MSISAGKNQQDIDYIKKQQLHSFRQLSRLKSDDLYCQRLASQSTDIFKNPVGFTQAKNMVPTTILINPQQLPAQKNGLQMINKLKRLKKKNPLDYRKNICGYITKKIIREFTSTQYMQKVQQLCHQFRCDYNDAKLYYSSKIEHVTGPSHIPGLLIPEDNSQRKFKLAFREFFQWFLRQQYLRYLLIEGKMSNKKAYIQYKNTTLLSLIAHKNIQFPIKVQQQQPQQNSSQEEEQEQIAEQNLNQRNQPQTHKQNTNQFPYIPKKISTPSLILVPMPVYPQDTDTTMSKNKNNYIFMRKDGAQSQVKIQVKGQVKIEIQ